MRFRKCMSLIYELLVRLWCVIYASILPRATLGTNPMSDLSAKKARMALILRAMRDAAGLSQIVWGEECGVGRGVIRRWEEGEAIPNGTSEKQIIEYREKNGGFPVPVAGTQVTKDEFTQLLREIRLGEASRSMEDGGDTPPVPEEETPELTPDGRIINLKFRNIGIAGIVVVLAVILAFVAFNLIFNGPASKAQIFNLGFDLSEMCGISLLADQRGATEQDIVSYQSLRNQVLSDAKSVDMEIRIPSDLTPESKTDRLQSCAEFDRLAEVKLGTQDPSSGHAFAYGQWLGSAEYAILRSQGLEKDAVLVRLSPALDLSNNQFFAFLDSDIISDDIREEHKQLHAEMEDLYGLGVVDADSARNIVDKVDKILQLIQQAD